MHGAGFIKTFVIIAAISLLFDIYVYSGLGTVARNWKSPLLRKWVPIVLPAISVTVAIWFIIGIGSLRHGNAMSPYREWVLSLFLTFLITKIFFVVVLFVGDIGRFLYGIVRFLIRTIRGSAPIKLPRSSSSSSSPHSTMSAGPFFPTRRKFIGDAALLISAVPFTAFFYAMLKGKYDYKVHRQTLWFPDLPEAFDGFTITQVSDIHSGSFDNAAAVQRGIDLAKAQKSDLFVFTGDLVNNIASEIEPWFAHFNQLKAPFGQFSILGNHDYGDYIEWNSEDEKAANLEKLKEHHKTLGYRLMLDENTHLERNGQKIALIGVQNWGRGFIQIGDIDKALEGVDKDTFKILLSHDPTHWEEKIRFHPTTVHLTLAGHTHGAQFGVETDKLRWSPVKYRYLDWAGLANEKDRYLYVNRGFGFLAFTGRLGIWPEVTVITLKRQTADA